MSGSIIFNQINNYRFKLPVLFLIILVTQGCGSHLYHFVEPGETLYSISWAYGHDYHDVAQWNQIPPPYVIKRGQRLRVAAPRIGAPVIDKTSKNSKIENSNSVRDVNQEPGINADKQAVVVSGRPQSVNNESRHRNLVWRWPIKQGKVIQAFDAHDPGKQGVDVTGQMGQPVYSAEAGYVVYSGGGLHRYGKLIIVKHNETFLSAYAHNKRLLVKQGEFLEAGQLIAEMGSTGTNSTKLHFEIRRNGKPVDPLDYLPKQIQ